MVVACKKDSAPADSGPAATESTSAFENGRKVYMANCIACHNVNPKLDGGIGPASFGATRELILQKVIYNKYPDGYTPKRPTRAMVALPHLEKDIDSLYAFLNGNQN